MFTKYTDGKTTKTTSGWIQYLIESKKKQQWTAYMAYEYFIMMKNFGHFWEVTEKEDAL